MQYRPALKVILALLVLWIAGSRANGQSIAGIKIGLSAPYVSPTNIIVTDQGVSYYEIAVAHTRFGIHAGLFLQLQMGHFFVQPELLYNSSSVEYKLDTLGSPDAGSANITDSYRELDLPLLLGFKAGAFRIGAGPVGHMFINSDNNFDGYNGYQSDFDKFGWGWQAGIGLDFWKLHFDFRYEDNYSKYGDYLTFFGKSYDFATDDNRFIGSVGLSF
jgi:hypothetical protein